MYNLVIFASGNGTTLQAIIDAINENRLEANINLVVSNNKNAFALERAKKAGIPTYLIKEKETDKDTEKELILNEYKYSFDKNKLKKELIKSIEDVKIK